jgi:hypothetical protein
MMALTNEEYAQLHEGAPDASDEEVIAGCLAWCNEKRAEQGMEPLAELPKGERRNYKSCPCGDATGLAVYSCAYAYPSEDLYVSQLVERGQTLPPLVREFVRRFDAGRLPQFDIEAG